ncbi:hypothetical protein XENOCAPTIV_021592 [Xenoophorus captivus]|uniref:Uncharacterized protein n=1 Tax=Xenoophorus captivus TaxID=1517983 RepID=A0ABV0SB47_9TELE
MGGRQAIAKETKSVNPQRYVASFDVKNTTKGDSGRYRCIAQSERGVGVSSYAELTVKRDKSLSFLWPFTCTLTCSGVLMIAKRVVIVVTVLSDGRGATLLSAAAAEISGYFPVSSVRSVPRSVLRL